MPRRFHLLWIPLLAALIAGPLATRASGDPSAEVLRAGESIGSAPLYPLPTARSALGLRLGSQPFRHFGPSWAAVPGHLATPAFEHRLLTIPVSAGPELVARAARHFPLFPTGPPAHS